MIVPVITPTRNRNGRYEKTKEVCITRKATITCVTLCVIEEIILIVGIPNFFIVRKDIATNRDKIDEDREYIIIIGFPNSKGTKIDFKNEMVSAEPLLTFNNAIRITILENPIFINGKKGITGGISDSIYPIIIARLSKIEVRVILVILFLFILS